MKKKMMSNIMRGLTTVSASVLTLSVLGTSIADSYRKNLDDFLGTTSFVTSTDDASARFVSDYDTIEDMAAADIGYEQLENIDDEYWDTLVSQITIDEAVGAVIHGGSQSDALTNVDNPIVLQNEGVNGFTTAYVDEETGKEYHFNVNSQTLLGSSFNPQLAYEWGLVEGNSGLWLDRYDLWGTGLTQRRTPYNGRNYEYISEDAMLTNRMGYGVISGCNEKGIINGANNASHYVPVLQTILREEWGYTGIISTDMMNNSYYFNPESMIMASVTQVADFGGDDGHINLGEGGVDATWAYISEDSVKNDATLVEQARENLKYQLYTFANSAVLNVSTVQVNTWWDDALSAMRTAGMSLTVLFALGWLVCTLIPEKKKEEKL